MSNTRLPMCLLTCRPVSGKHAAAEKRCWNDVVFHDMKECDLLPDWCDWAKDRGAWRCLVGEALMEFNDTLEAAEEEKSDERKRRCCPD